MNVSDGALKYCVVRRVGTNGKLGVELDAFINTALKNPDVRRLVMKDYDERFSDAMPEDLLGLNAMVGE